MGRGKGRIGGFAKGNYPPAYADNLRRSDSYTAIAEIRRKKEEDKERKETLEQASPDLETLSRLGYALKKKMERGQGYDEKSQDYKIL